MAWGLQAGLNYSYSSAPPFNVSGIDFNADGTTGALLPGITLAAFNRSLGSADLARLVSHLNQSYGGTLGTHRRPIPRLTLSACIRSTMAFSRSICA